MLNGNAFHAFLQDSLQFLEALTTTLYYPEPMPSETDDIIRTIIERFMRATAVEQKSLHDAFGAKPKSIMGIFAHRAATISVRQNSREWLLVGLTAVGIAHYTLPTNRDLGAVLIVPHHCALKLGLDPAEIFAEAAQYTSEETAVTLIQFGKRTDVRLRTYGWWEKKGPDGIQYRMG